MNMQAQTTTVRGTLHHSDLEGGHWQLITNDGTVYVLGRKLPAAADGTRETIRDGAQVQVTGKTGGMSLFMTGQPLTVDSIEVL